MAVNKLFNPKMPANWTKNVAKSFGYAIKDKMQGYNPVISSLISETKEIKEDIFGQVEDFKEPDIDLIKFGKNTFKNTLKNSLDDIKNGNLYDSQKADPLGDITLKLMGMDLDTSDFDMGDMDFNTEDWGDSDFDDFGDDTKAELSSDEAMMRNDTRNTVATMNTINMVGGKVAGAISTVTAESAQYIAQSNMANSKVLYNLNQKGFSTVTESIMAVNSSIVSFAKIGQPLTDHINNSATFYTKTTEMLNQMNESLAKIVENTTPASVAGKQESESAKGGLRDIFSESGVSVKGFLNMVKKNFGLDDSGEGSSMIDAVKDIIKEGGIKNISLPAVAMKKMVDVMFAKTLEASMKQFNDTLKYSMGAGLIKARRGTGNPMIDLLIGYFTPEDKFKSEKSFNTGAYEKGPVQFDGITRKAITEVIPISLMKIYSAITGEEEMRYDYNRGKFIKYSGIKATIREERENYSTNYATDIKDEAERIIESMESDAKAQQALIEQVNSFYKNIFGEASENLDLKALSEDKNYWKKNKVGLTAKSQQALAAALGKGSNVQRFIVEHQQARDEYGDFIREKELKGDSLYSYSKDGWTEEAKKNKSKSGRFFDEFGHNDLFYLRGIYNIINGTEAPVNSVGGIFPNNNVVGGGKKEPTAHQKTERDANADNINSSTINDDMASTINPKEDKTKAERWSEDGKTLQEQVNKKKDQWLSSFGVRNSLKTKFESILATPANAVGGLINSITDSINQFFWGEDPNNPGKKSIFGIISEKFQSGIDELFKTLFDGKGFKEKLEEWKTRLFGEKDEEGNRTGGFFSDFINETGDELKSAGKFVSEPVTSFFKSGEGSGLLKYYSGAGKGKGKRIHSHYANRNQSKQDKENMIERAMKVGNNIKSVVTKNNTDDNKDSENKDKESQFSKLKHKVVSDFKDTLGKDLEKVFDIFMGDPKKDNEKVKDVMKKSGKTFWGEAKDNKGSIAAGAIIGSGVSILTGGLISPIFGAAVGAGTGLIVKSEKVQKLLFGDIDEETGERMGDGLLNKKMTEFLTKHLGATAKGAGIGTAAGLFMGSPFLGAILGGAVGFISTSERAKKALFGDEEDEGLIPKKLQESIKERYPYMAAGAIAGIVAGPFGMVPNIILGAGMGFMASSDDFKKFLFGDPDNEKDTGFVGKIKDTVLNPLDELMHNIANRTKGFLKRLGRNIRRKVRRGIDYILDNASKGRGIFRLLTPIYKAGEKVTKGAMNLGAKVAGATVGKLNERMKKANLKQGYDVFTRKYDDEGRYIGKGSANAAERLKMRSSLKANQTGSAAMFDQFLSQAKNKEDLVEVRKLINQFNKAYKDEDRAEIIEKLSNYKFKDAEGNETDLSQIAKVNGVFKGRLRGDARDLFSNADSLIDTELGDNFKDAQVTQKREEEKLTILQKMERWLAGVTEEGKPITVAEADGEQKEQKLFRDKLVDATSVVSQNVADICKAITGKATTSDFDAVQKSINRHNKKLEKQKEKEDKEKSKVEEAIDDIKDTSKSAIDEVKKVTEEVVNEVGNTAEAVNEADGDNPKKVGRFGKFRQDWKNQWGEFSDDFNNTKLGHKVSKGADALKEGTIEAANISAEGIKSLPGNAKRAGKYLVTGLEDVAENSAVTKGINALIDKRRKNKGKGKFGQWANQALGGLNYAASEMKGGAIDFGKDIVDQLESEEGSIAMKNLSSWFEPVAGEGSGLLPLLSGAGIGAALAGVASKAGSAIAKGASKAGSAIAKGAKGLAGKAGSAIKTGAKNLGSKALNGIKSLPGKALNGLKALPGKALNGMKNLAVRGLDAATGGMFSAVSGGIKGLLGSSGGAEGGAAGGAPGDLQPNLKGSVSLYNMITGQIEKFKRTKDGDLERDASDSSTAASGGQLSSFHSSLAALPMLTTSIADLSEKVGMLDSGINGDGSPQSEEESTNILDALTGGKFSALTEGMGTVTDLLVGKEGAKVAAGAAGKAGGLLSGVSAGTIATGAGLIAALAAFGVTTYKLTENITKWQDENDDLKKRDSDWIWSGKSVNDNEAANRLDTMIADTKGPLGIGIGATSTMDNVMSQAMTGLQKGSMTLHQFESFIKRNNIDLDDYPVQKKAYEKYKKEHPDQVENKETIAPANQAVIKPAGSGSGLLKRFSGAGLFDALFDTESEATKQYRQKHPNTPSFTTRGSSEYNPNAAIQRTLDNLVFKVKVEDLKINPENESIKEYLRRNLRAILAIYERAKKPLAQADLSDLKVEKSEVSDKELLETRKASYIKQAEEMLGRSLKDDEKDKVVKMAENGENIVAGMSEILNSGSGSRLRRFSGAGSGFVSQRSSKYKDISYAGSNFADKGCAPSVASMAASSVGKNLSVNDAIASSSKYQNEYGTSIDYFDKTLKSAGVSTSPIGSAEGALDSLSRGNSVIMLGRDPYNTSKANSPFGPNGHYVLATGIDRDGNISVNDPEMSGPTSYSASDLLRGMTIGESISSGGGSKSDKKKLKKLKKQLEKTINSAARTELQKQIDALEKTTTGDDKGGTIKYANNKAILEVVDGVVGHENGGKPGNVSNNHGTDGTTWNYGIASLPSHYKGQPLGGPERVRKLAKKRFPKIYKLLKGKVDSKEFRDGWKEAGRKYKKEFLDIQIEELLSDKLTPNIKKIKKNSGVDLNDGTHTTGLIGYILSALNWKPILAADGKDGDVTGGQKYARLASHFDKNMSEKELIKGVHDTLDKQVEYFGGKRSKFYNGWHNRWIAEEKEALKKNTTFKFDKNGGSSDGEVDMGTEDGTTDASSKQEEPVTAGTYLDQLNSVFSNAFEAALGNKSASEGITHDVDPFKLDGKNVFEETSSDGSWLSSVKTVKEKLAKTGTKYSQQGSVKLKLGKSNKERDVRTDCSGYVSAVVSDFLDRDFRTDSRGFTSNLTALTKAGFKKKKWKGWDELKEGDILARNGHVEISAGKPYKVYNAGGDNSIASTGPTTTSHKDGYTTVWRYTGNKKSSDKNKDKDKSGSGSGLFGNFIEVKNPVQRTAQRPARRYVSFNNISSGAGSDMPNHQNEFTTNKSGDNKDYIKMMQSIVSEMKSMDEKLNYLGSTFNVQQELLAFFRKFAEYLLNMKSAEAAVNASNNEANNTVDPEFENLMSILTDLAKN